MNECELKMSLKRGGQRRKHKIQQTLDAGKSAFRRSIFGPSWTDADNMWESRRKERENSVLTLVTVCGFCRSKRLFIIHHDVFPLQVPACRLLCYFPLSGLTPPRLNPPPPTSTPSPKTRRKALETMNRTTIRVHRFAVFCLSACT